MREIVNGNPGKELSIFTSILIGHSGKIKGVRLIPYPDVKDATIFFISVVPSEKLKIKFYLNLFYRWYRATSN